MKSKSVIIVEGKELTLTNLDKPLWPKEGLTKGHLIKYLIDLAPAIIPHLYNRPLTVVRYPDGIEGQFFYQKDCPDYAPEWIKRYPVFSSDSGKLTNYILANSTAALVWLANQGSIEYHPWMSPIDRSSPDYAVIDLDPGKEASFQKVKEAAYLAKLWLDRLGLESFPKTSGSEGIHIYIYLQPVYTYKVTSRLVGLIGKLMEKDHPRLITTERMVQKRPKQSVYVDHLQNLPGKTIVSAYSPRPHPKGTVSAPFTWDQLFKMDPSEYTIADPHKLMQPWPDKPLNNCRQRLDRAIEVLRAYGFGESSDW
jgi:bifunctional non-homologous end joining protein LigD